MEPLAIWRTIPLKKYKTCIMSLTGCLFGLLVVHVTSFTMAVNNKTAHATRHDAFWQAVFYDFLVGPLVAALCGWGVASYMRLRGEAPLTGVGESEGG
jgi:hypothetical protein